MQPAAVKEDTIDAVPVTGRHFGAGLGVVELPAAIHYIFNTPDDSAHHAHKNGVRAARRQALKADIAGHLSDPRLSLETLAKRHGVSSRYVRALFYDEGTSFTDYLMAARLDYVRALLLDPLHRDMNIAMIAMMAGFGDISWFNQVFRRRFQATPSHIREGGR